MNALPYGSQKRGSRWPHPHNKCGVCGELIIHKRKDREENKQYRILKKQYKEYGKLDKAWKMILMKRDKIMGKHQNFIRACKNGSYKVLKEYVENNA